MITYTVKYRRTGFPSKWKKIKNVKGDGIVENGLTRFFYLEDETRIEIPMPNTIFKFSKERFYSIQERMEEEAGQPLQINKR
jgi:hypothetical protein